MRIASLTLLLIIPVILFSQRRKKTNDVPPSTSAEQRWQGYEQRQKLEAGSLVKMFHSETWDQQS